MKTIMIRFLIPVLIIFPLTVNAQGAQEDTTYWKRGFKGNLTFQQANLTNWASGGENSISLSSYINLFANYQKGRIKWENNLEMGYGFIDQKDRGFQKTDDKLNFATKFGYRLKEEGKLKWTSLISFRTQFDKGFDFPDDSTVISDFMAPAYFVLSTGLEYAPQEWLSFIYSPVTGKMTIVNNQNLANQGAFGVEPAVVDSLGNIIEEGQTTRGEFGTLLRATINREIFENVNMESKIELFTNYVKNFGEIDVNFENVLLMKVNEWLSANLIIHLIYDKDVEFPVKDANGDVIGVEDRVQFKEIFGIGLSYTLTN